MNKIATLILLLASIGIYAQETYPRILNFDADSKSTNDKGDKEWKNKNYHFLMISADKAIDLSNYVNKLCQFKILATKPNKVMLEFNQPSKLIGKGMCASGEEIGFLYLELNDANEVLESKIFLVESCLLGIETIQRNQEDSKIILYHCENFQSSQSFTLKIDLDSIDIIKKY